MNISIVKTSMNTTESTTLTEPRRENNMSIKRARAIKQQAVESEPLTLNNKPSKRAIVVE